MFYLKKETVARLNPSWITKDFELTFDYMA